MSDPNEGRPCDETLMRALQSQRDQAEDRFVRARAENDELEQEVADMIMEMLRIRENLRKRDKIFWPYVLCAGLVGAVLTMVLMR